MNQNEIVMWIWLLCAMLFVILAALKTKGWLAPVFVAIVWLGIGYWVGVIK